MNASMWGVGLIAVLVVGGGLYFFTRAVGEGDAMMEKKSNAVMMEDKKDEAMMEGEGAAMEDKKDGAMMEAGAKVEGDTMMQN